LHWKISSTICPRENHAHPAAGHVCEPFFYIYGGQQADLAGMTMATSEASRGRHHPIPNLPLGK
jgi:hypothetical protein